MRAAVLLLLLPCVFGAIREEPCWSTHGGHCQTRCHSGGTLLTGKCPTQPSAVKCCAPANEGPCQRAGGSCRFTDTPCSGAYQSGLCPTQPSAVKCCVPSGGDSTSGILPSFSQFQAAARGCGYSAPPRSKYDGLTNAAGSGDISSKREMAMFLAQTFYETAGLHYMREISPSRSYAQPGCDAPGQQYYGRGYIQLTWCENYKKASRDLFNDNRLVTNPDQVATSETIAWQVSFWYWKTRVHSYVQTGKFGMSTRHINGGQCTSSRLHDKAKARFNCYKKVFAAMNVPGIPDESGCYN